MENYDNRRVKLVSEKRKCERIRNKIKKKKETQVPVRTFGEKSLKFLKIKIQIEEQIKEQIEVKNNSW